MIFQIQLHRENAGGTPALLKTSVIRKVAGSRFSDQNCDEEKFLGSRRWIWERAAGTAAAPPSGMIPKISRGQCTHLAKRLTS